MQFWLNPAFLIFYPSGDIVYPPDPPRGFERKTFRGSILECPKELVWKFSAFLNDFEKSSLSTLLEVEKK